MPLLLHSQEAGRHSRAANARSPHPDAPASRLGSCRSSSVNPFSHLLTDRPLLRIPAPAQLARTWSRSYATVLAYADGRLVGAGRAISDGEREALIVGVVVLPSYQRRGIGSRMMAALTEAVKGTAILLTCEEDENVPFYRQLGFRTHKRVMALGYRGGYAE